MRIVSRVFILILTMLLLLPGSAFATYGAYDVVNEENNTIGQNARGTDASIWVMTNPTIADKHVSSVYVDNGLPDGPGLYMAESGWYAARPETGGQPRWFSAWVANGGYGQNDWENAPGGNHTVQVSYWSAKWHWYTDGTNRKNMPLDSWGAIAGGKSTAASERDDYPGDTNYSHFWNVKKKSSGGAWSAWTNRNVWIDSDPVYNTVQNGSPADFFIQQ